MLLVLNDWPRAGELAMRIFFSDSPPRGFLISGGADLNRSLSSHALNLIQRTFKKMTIPIHL